MARTIAVSNKFTWSQRDSGHQSSTVSSPFIYCRERDLRREALLQRSRRLSLGLADRHLPPIVDTETLADIAGSEGNYIVILLPPIVDTEEI